MNPQHGLRTSQTSYCQFAAERGLSKHNAHWEGLALLVAFRLHLGFLNVLSRASARPPALDVLPGSLPATMPPTVIKLEGWSTSRGCPMCIASLLPGAEVRRAQGKMPHNRGPIRATVVAPPRDQDLTCQDRASHFRPCRENNGLAVAICLDVAALGAARKHSRACSALSPGFCPYRALLGLLGSEGPHEPVLVDACGSPPAKAGWADTFRAITSIGHPNLLRQMGLHSSHWPSLRPLEESSSRGYRHSVDGVRTPSAFGISGPLSWPSCLGIGTP